MFLDELFGLHEHPAASAAGVINTMFRRGLQHCYQRSDHTGRSVIFSSALALFAGELLKTVLIGTAKNILIFTVFTHPDVREKINNVSQPPLIQFVPGIILRENIL